MSDTRDALMVARNSEGKLVKRPLSPHLQIYRPQISTGLSIFHRITGVILSVGTLLLTWWLVAAAASPAAYGHVQGFVGSPIGLLFLFGWTASLWYHFLAGIRHLGWDAGYGYGIKEFHQTGMAVLIGTAVLTVLSWVIGLVIWHGAH
jgi:succinate dehydrogenase / fumarate reductase, cytochrome b subunit